MRRAPLLSIPLALVAAITGLGLAADPLDDPPRGPFGYALVETASGRPADIDEFFLSSDCGLCHPQQWRDLKGSMHSAAHFDPLYRSFAEMARREAGEETYTYCSGCHSPAGVVSGLIPNVAEEDLPAEATAGVTCDVCHQISELTGHAGPWREPGNASFVMDPGRVKFGPVDEIERNPAHKGASREFLASSEFCASCHSIIHPVNGLRIEHTYEEWRGSIYAEKGIQCQDCHMRSVDDAIEVARTLAPIDPATRTGLWALKGEVRPMHVHEFVGGNVHAGELADGPRHGRAAERRLQSAAELALELPEAATSGAPLAFEVVVTNVGAGHNLPTSLTELREMWVHLRVLAPDGAVLFESGALDAEGEIPEGTIRFGAHTVDAQGEVTYKPWEAVDFAWKRLIPPKGSARDAVSFELPAGTSGELRLEARLLYRIAPPKVIAMVMGAEAFDPKSVEMATTSATLPIR